MKKLLLIIVPLFILILLLISSQGYAADWNSEEGFEYLIDEEYQVRIAIIRCMDRYDSEKLVKQCAYNQSMAYDDVVSSMILLFKGEQDGINVSEPLGCLAGGMNRYWDPDYNSANWISVQKYFSECIKQ